MPSIISVIILYTLLYISESKRFLTTGFPTGGDLNDDTKSTEFEIYINQENTTITIYSHEAVWYGIGFGGARMEDVDYAVIYEGDYPSQIIADQQISGQGQGTRLHTDLWRLDEYDTSAVINNGPAKIQFSRNNDVSAVCAECYTFDPDATSLQIILAKGTSGTTYGYHGPGLNKRGETITALPDTESPTEIPTREPTTNPTKEPTAVPTLHECVYADDIIDGVTLSIERDYANKRIAITLVQELQYEPADPWFAFGFGAREMNGTYAIVVAADVEGFAVEERILGASGTFDAPGEVVDTESIIDHYINNGMRYVTVIRDYTVDGLYDFERFIDCKRPTPTIPVIAAKGTTVTYNLDGTVADPDGQSPEIFGYHGENRAVGTIMNMCCHIPSTTWFDMSTSFYDASTTDEEIIEETEKLTTTNLCENGVKYTMVDDCEGDPCTECEDDDMCTIDPCGCKAICDDSMGFMIGNVSISVLMVIMGWLLL